jgi:hypothetical protein
VLLHPVGFACHVVHLGGPDAVSIKSTLGHVTPNVQFLHLVCSTGHIVHSSAFGV